MRRRATFGDPCGVRGYNAAMCYSLRTLLLLTILGLPLLAQGGDPPSGTAKKELEKLQGDWLLVFWRADGKDLDAAKEIGTAGDKATITFSGSSFVVRVGKDAYEEGTVSIDTSTSPPGLNVSTTKLSGQPHVAKQAGIYLLRDNLFIACLGLGGNKASVFSAEAGENTELVVYRRLNK